MSKFFLYLVQCEGWEAPYPDLLSNGRRDVVYLSWKKEHKSMVHLADSTWTQGRNELFKRASGLEHRYKYYIFLDDDIMFEKGDFHRFEVLLLENKPAIATPCLFGYQNGTDHRMKVHTVTKFDACMNAFHDSVFYGQTVLPYVDVFDRYSWWYSQYILIVLSNLFYKGNVIQFNEIRIINGKARPYPRDICVDFYDLWLIKIKRFLGLRVNLDNYLFKAVDRWIYSKLLSDFPSIRKAKIEWESNCVEVPAPAKETYFIPDPLRQEFFRD
ncbi:MAG: hypothetical protein MI975_21750 [Cytophagales bacterium]|nr:hypothetical protein [Cytophagales bacterium]